MAKTSNQPSGAVRTAILYITVGALIIVWSTIYWIYLARHAEGQPDTAYYWVYGLFSTGIVLMVIGMALERIGRAARHAELPPTNSSQPANAAPSVTVLIPSAVNGQPKVVTTPIQPAATPGTVILPAQPITKPIPTAQAVSTPESLKTSR